ncbi:MAG: hypothetical protein WB643_13280 [Candidatus Bathyarchaeia archaeon]
MKDRKTLVLLVLSIVSLLAAFSGVRYAGTLGPVLSSERVTIPVSSTIDVVTTVGTRRSATTYMSVTVSSYGSYGSSCPYGGTYFSSIYTSLCGWQYDVCVTFDSNCSDDYHPVYQSLLVTRTVFASTTKTGYEISTSTSTSIQLLLGTSVMTVPNKSKQDFVTISEFLTVLGLAILASSLLLLKGRPINRLYPHLHRNRRLSVIRIHAPLVNTLRSVPSC